MTAIALLILAVLLQHDSILRTTAKPASILVLSRCLNHIYRVQKRGVGFLFSHLKSNLVGLTLPLDPDEFTPNDKVAKKLDAAGHKFYSTGVLGIKGIMRFSEVLDIVPKERQQRARALQKEGMVLGSSYYLCKTHLELVHQDTKFSGVLLMPCLAPFYRTPTRHQSYNRRPFFFFKAKTFLAQPQIQCCRIWTRQCNPGLIWDRSPPTLLNKFSSPV